MFRIGLLVVPTLSLNVWNRFSTFLQSFPPGCWVGLSVLFGVPSYSAHPPVWRAATWFDFPLSRLCATSSVNAHGTGLRLLLPSVVAIRFHYPAGGRRLIQLGMRRGYIPIEPTDSGFGPLSWRGFPSGALGSTCTCTTRPRGIVPCCPTLPGVGGLRRLWRAGAILP